MVFPQIFQWFKFIVGCIRKKNGLLAIVPAKRRKMRLSANVPLMFLFPKLTLMLTYCTTPPIRYTTNRHSSLERRIGIFSAKINKCYDFEFRTQFQKSVQLKQVTENLNCYIWLKSPLIHCVPEAVRFLPYFQPAVSNFVFNRQMW